jgi:hypothetical protein
VKLQRARLHLTHTTECESFAFSASAALTMHESYPPNLADDTATGLHALSSLTGCCCALALSARQRENKHESNFSTAKSITLCFFSVSYYAVAARCVRAISFGFRCFGGRAGSRPGGWRTTADQRPVRLAGD